MQPQQLSLLEFKNHTILVANITVCLCFMAFFAHVNEERNTGIRLEIKGNNYDSRFSLN